MITAATTQNKEQIDCAIAGATQQFPDKIERIRYNFGQDWANDPAIFFRILLKEEAIGSTADKQLRRRAMLDASILITDKLRSGIKIDGFEPYFSFRSVAEQRELRDLEWD